MARWRFAGGTGAGGALKFPLTLPAGDYVYTTVEDGDVELSSAEPIVINQDIIKNGLVAWYDFTEPAGSQVLTDKSGNGYHGQNGRTEGADTNDMTFDGIKGVTGGDDYIDCGVEILPQIADKFTLITVQSISANNLIDGYPRTIQVGAGANIMINDKSIRGCIAFFNKINGVNYDVTLSNGGSIIAEVPQMTAITFDSTRLTGYINGVNTGVNNKGDTPGNVQQDGGKTIIANRPDLLRGLLGPSAIYYVLIYNRDLSDSEMLQTYETVQKLLAKRGVVLG